MNKKIIALFLVTLAVLPAIAMAMPKKLSEENLGKANGQAGKSTVNNLYLVQKESTDPWAIIPDGAWGKMTFNTKNDKFTFNGHKVTPSAEYSLIYYPDPWPGTGCIVLGTGKSNKGGNVNINGKFDFSTIPIKGDTNKGAKIWLVLSSDVNCQTIGTTGMTAWNPTQYLFEYDLINKPTTTL
jgi:hypothetical protein